MWHGHPPCCGTLSRRRRPRMGRSNPGATSGRPKRAVFVVPASAGIWAEGPPPNELCVVRGSSFPSNRGIRVRAKGGTTNGAFPTAYSATSGRPKRAKFCLRGCGARDRCPLGLAVGVTGAGPRIRITSRPCGPAVPKPVVLWYSHDFRISPPVCRGRPSVPTAQGVARELPANCVGVSDRRAQGIAYGGHESPF